MTNGISAWNTVYAITESSGGRGPAIGITPTSDANTRSPIFDGFIGSITGTLAGVISVKDAANIITRAGETVIANKGFVAVVSISNCTEATTITET